MGKSVALKYSTEREWVALDGSSPASIGITTLRSLAALNQKIAATSLLPVSHQSGDC
jgi:glycine cleavage system H lipoate-binding protein